jgi:hypothetical protein
MREEREYERNQIMTELNSYLSYDQSGFWGQTLWHRSGSGGLSNPENIGKEL